MDDHVPSSNLRPSDSELIQWAQLLDQFTSSLESRLERRRELYREIRRTYTAGSFWMTFFGCGLALVTVTLTSGFLAVMLASISVAGLCASAVLLIWSPSRETSVKSAERSIAQVSAALEKVVGGASRANAYRNASDVDRLAVELRLAQAEVALRDAKELLK